MAKRKAATKAKRVTVKMLAKLLWEQQTELEKAVRETTEDNRRGMAKDFGWFDFPSSTPTTRREIVTRHAAQVMTLAGLWRDAIDQCKANGIVNEKCELPTKSTGVSRGGDCSKKNWLPSEWAAQSTGVDYLRQPAGWKILEWWRTTILPTIAD